MMKRAAVFCIGAVLFTHPVYAGFEYMPGSSQVRAQTPAPQAPQSVLTAEPPMPILPTEPVSAEPLPAPNTGNQILSAPVSRAQPRRSPPSQTTAIRAPANQPFDSEAVLDAAILGEPLQMVDNAPATAAAMGEEYIAINPYPLQDAAVHDGAGDQAVLEQGMMENTGMLRPVAIPGARRTASSKRKPAEEQFETAMVDTASQETYFTPVEEAPLSPPPRKPDAPRIPDSPAPLNAAYTEAIGFGKDLPLALALSQVVPAGYSYSFAQNVDAGATVSWQGGKPWNEVLNEMLAPSGMRAAVRGNQVVIENV